MKCFICDAPTWNGVAGYCSKKCENEGKQRITTKNTFVHLDSDCGHDTSNSRRTRSFPANFGSFHDMETFATDDYAEALPATPDSDGPLRTATPDSYSAFGCSLQRENEEIKIKNTFIYLDSDCRDDTSNSRRTRSFPANFGSFHMMEPFATDDYTETLTATSDSDAPLRTATPDSYSAFDCYSRQRWVDIEDAEVPDSDERNTTHHDDEKFSETNNGNSTCQPCVNKKHGCTGDSWNGDPLSKCARRCTDFHCAHEKLVAHQPFAMGKMQNNEDIIVNDAHLRNRDFAVYAEDNQQQVKDDDGRPDMSCERQHFGAPAFHNVDKRRIDQHPEAVNLANARKVIGKVMKLAFRDRNGTREVQDAFNSLQECKSDEARKVIQKLTSEFHGNVVKAALHRFATSALQACILVNKIQDLSFVVAELQQFGAAHCASDKHGSRVLRRLIEVDTDTYSHDSPLRPLLSDLTDSCNIEQKDIDQYLDAVVLTNARKVIGKVMELASCDQNGTWEVQDAFNSLQGCQSDEAREVLEKLTSEFQENVARAVLDPWAHYALQACILANKIQDLSFVVAELQQFGAACCASHNYGCRVLQRLIEVDTGACSNDSPLWPLLGDIIDNCANLCQTCSNARMELSAKKATAALNVKVQHRCSRCSCLCQHGKGIYVLESMLKDCNENYVQRLMDKLTMAVKQKSLDSEGKDFVGHVILKALERGNKDGGHLQACSSQLAEAIRADVDFLFNMCLSRYGSKAAAMIINEAPDKDFGRRFFLQSSPKNEDGVIRSNIEEMFQQEHRYGKMLVKMCAAHNDYNNNVWSCLHYALCRSPMFVAAQSDPHAGHNTEPYGVRNGLIMWADGSWVREDPCLWSLADIARKIHENPYKPEDDAEERDDNAPAAGSKKAQKKNRKWS